MAIRDPEHLEYCVDIECPNLNNNKCRRNICRYWPKWYDFWLIYGTLPKDTKETEREGSEVEEE